MLLSVVLGRLFWSMCSCFIVNTTPLHGEGSLWGTFSINVDQVQQLIAVALRWQMRMCQLNLNKETVGGCI